MESFAFLLVSKLKTSLVIDYEISDKPFCSIFRISDTSGNNFFEYFLNQSARLPRELEENHKKLGVDEFGYFFVEIDLRYQIARDIFEKTIANLQKGRLTGNIYNIAAMGVELEGFTMCCSPENPYIRNISGRFLQEEGESYSIQPCLDSMLYWHKKDEENLSDEVSKIAEKIRELFSSQYEYKKIKDTVIDVFTYVQKTGIRSIFDKKGKSIQDDISELRNLYTSAYLAKHNGVISQLSLASFGFNNPNAIICAGFLKIINTNYDINDRYNWDDYNLYLHIALIESATFGDALFTLFWERHWNSTLLLQFAPLRKIIPEGFFLPPGNNSHTDIEFKEKEFLNFNSPTFDNSDLSGYIRSFKLTYGWRQERGQTIEEHVMDMHFRH